MKIKTLLGMALAFFLVWGVINPSGATEPESEKTTEVLADQQTLLARAEAGAADETLLSDLLDTSLKIDDLDTAIEWGRKGVERFPQNPTLKIKLADALQRKMSKMPISWMTGKGEYIELLESAINLNPKQPEPYYYLMGFYLGAPGFVGGSTEKALDAAQRLRQHDEKEGALAMTQVYVKQGDEQAWRETFAQLLEQGSNPSVHYKFGMALQESGAYDEALVQFNQAAKQDHVEAIYQAGRTRILGKFAWQEAIADFDRFLNRVEGTPHQLTAGAWWRKGQAHEALGHLEQAIQCLSTALEIEPEMKNAKKDLARITDKLGG